MGVKGQRKECWAQVCCLYGAGTCLFDKSQETPTRQGEPWGQEEEKGVKSEGHLGWVGKCGGSG